jgi:hypothetical protein
MYLGGVVTFEFALGQFGRIHFSPYDIMLAFVALLLLSFFVVTAIQEIIRLAKENK